MSPEKAQEALHAYFVDTLVDLADPSPSEEEDVRGDMEGVVNIIFEGLGVEVVSSDADQVLFSVTF